MRAVLWLFDTLVDLATYALIASAVLSWLVSFNVVNPRNAFVSQVGTLLERVTEPLLRPVRRVLPNLGGIDLSPVVVILGLKFLQILVHDLAGSLVVR